MSDCVGRLGHVWVVAVTSLWWYGSVKPCWVLGCCSAASYARPCYLRQTLGSSPSRHHKHASWPATIWAPVRPCAASHHPCLQAWPVMCACMATQPCKHARFLTQPPAVCKRVGGGFGGKVSRPNAVAIPAALAAQKTGQPVRFVLSRNDDFRLNGGGACAQTCQLLQPPCCSAALHQRNAQAGGSWCERSQMAPALLSGGPCHQPMSSLGRELS